MTIKALLITAVKRVVEEAKVLEEELKMLKELEEKKPPSLIDYIRLSGKYGKLKKEYEELKKKLEEALNENKQMREKLSKCICL